MARAVPQGHCRKPFPPDPAALATLRLPDAVARREHIRRPPRLCPACGCPVEECDVCPDCGTCPLCGGRTPYGCSREDDPDAA
jgi:hypothetical protein